jgi:Icc-related predicted phosphoesterase
MARISPLLLSSLAVFVAACAATPVAQRPPAPSPAAAKVVATSQETLSAPAAESPSDAPPATWKDALDRFGSTCPVPFFTLAQPTELTAGGATFALAGSTLTRKDARGTGRWQGPLKIGVLGAIKDAEIETRENVKKAAAAFKKAGVHVVVANGDLVGDETSALVPVVRMLGEELDVPVLAHSGNYEWTSAFTEALAGGAVTWPHVINMNIVRDVDFGGIHIVSLPGYFNRKFAQSGACHYEPDDVDELTRHARALSDRGDVVVLTSHGPPLGTSAAALDVTHEGTNVGDAHINQLLTDGDVRFGLFSHILEAGGRAVDDAAGASAVPLPMKAARKRLYVNAGAATSYGWGMIGGKTSRGIAAIVTIDATSTPAGEARVEFVTLR